MKKVAIFILLSLILSGGCSKQVRITDDIKLCCSKPKNLNLVMNGKLLCSNIEEVWFDNPYLYGWFYSEGKNYTMFIFDISNQEILTDNKAREKILELQLPVNRWTNYAEIFNESITDHGRRNHFFENIEKLNQ